MRYKLLILLVAGFFGWILFFNKPPQEEIKIASVKKEEIKETISASGILTGKQSATLKFKTSGKLTYQPFNIGADVSQGTVLANLDTTQVSIDLQQAQNSLRDKQAAAEKTLDDVKDHKSDETFTQKQNRTTAEVARDNAYDNLRAAQRAFQDYVIVAPFSGTITNSPFHVGQFISVSDNIVSLVNWESVYFDTEIDEAEISKVSLGDPVEVELNAYPDQIFEGTLEEILPQTKTTSSGATVVIARINLGKPNIHLIPNLNGQASIIINQSDNSLVVPQEAIFDQKQVYVKENGLYKLVQIETGIEGDLSTEVISGLKEGQEIVLNPGSVRVDQSSFFAGFFGRK